MKYKQTLFYFVLLCIIIMAMVMTRSCSQTNIPQLRTGYSQGDTLDVGIIYGPLSYYVYGDTLGGLNLDLLNQFEKDTETPLMIWPIVNLSKAFGNLENKKFDIVASVPFDSWIKDNFAFTESLYFDRLVLVQLSKEGKKNINSILELDGDTVFIPKNSPAINRINNLSNEIGGKISVFELEDLSEEYACIEVAAGNLKNAIVNEKIAKMMKEFYPDLNYESPISFTQFQVWIMQKNDTLLRNKINDWFNSYKSTTSYRQLLQRYS